MNITAARLVRVLSGDASVAMLHAVDAEGHELRLEVPASTARAAVPGQVLVVQWSLHRIPDAFAGEREPLAEHAAMAATTVHAPSPDADAAAPETLDPVQAEFERLLGITLRSDP